MDALTAERGVMMFWPLTQARFTSPIKIFYGVQWGLGWFSLWHLWTFFTESLFVLVVIVAVNHFDNRRNQANIAHSKRNESQEKYE
jgi:inner membrane protein